MYNYSQGYTVGGGMGNIGAYAGLMGDINNMMQSISPEAGQMIPGMTMYAPNQVVGGFQGTAGGNVGGLVNDPYPARNSGFLNKTVL